MKKALTGKIALVTGGSKGIGYAIFQALAREGASVAIAARGEEDLKRAVQEVTQQYGGNHSYLMADLSDLENVTPLLQQVQKTHGKFPDVVVASAGEPSGDDYRTTPTSSLMKKWMLEYFSIKELFRQAANEMSRGGFLFAISSQAGLQEKVLPGMSGYAPVKAAVNKEMQQITLELAKDNIRAYAICPPSTNSPGLQKLIRSIWDDIKGAKSFQEAHITTPEQYFEKVLQPEEVGESVVQNIQNPQDNALITYPPEKSFEF